MEAVGEYADELSEVDAFVGDVVEDGFGFVALVFYVADFHVEMQVFRDFSGLEHGALLECFCFFPFFEVEVARDAIDAPELICFWVDAVFVHLNVDETTHEGYLADVVSGLCFNGDEVSFFERESVGVAVVSFAGVFELYFDEFGCCLRLGEVGEPVVDV